MKQLVGWKKLSDHFMDEKKLISAHKNTLLKEEVAGALDQSTAAELWLTPDAREGPVTLSVVLNAAVGTNKPWFKYTGNPYSSHMKYQLLVKDAADARKPTATPLPISNVFIRLVWKNNCQVQTGLIPLISKKVILCVTRDWPAVLRRDALPQADEYLHNQ